jgi:5-methylcytosine-specific restriction endonuclease McrA
MTAKPKSSCKAISANFNSPYEELTYRAVVFARVDGHKTPLYYVAGVAGGPWSAPTALLASHKAHGGQCVYCKKGISKGNATIDHVEPLKLGGKSSIQNLVIACQPCNSSKSHKVIDAYNPAAGKAWLQALHKQIEQRLSALNPPSSPQPPSPDARVDP